MFDALVEGGLSGVVACTHVLVLPTELAGERVDPAKGALMNFADVIERGNSDTWPVVLEPSLCCSESQVLKLVVLINGVDGRKAQVFDVLPVAQLALVHGSALELLGLVGLLIFFISFEDVARNVLKRRLPAFDGFVG